MAGYLRKPGVGHLSAMSCRNLTEVTGIIVRYRAFGGPLLEDCIATDTVYIH